MRTHLIMNAHRLTTFQDIKTEGRKSSQAGSQCGDGEDGRRDGCGRLLEGIAQRSYQRCRKEHELQGRVLVLQGRRKRTVEGRRRATAMAEERAKSKIARKRFKCGKVGHMSKDLQSNAFVVDNKGLGKDWMLRHGEHRVECAVPLPEGDGKLRIGIDSLTVFPKTPAEY